MLKRTEKQVLIISSSEKGEEFFRRYLDDGYCLDAAKSGAEGRRKLEEKDYDVVIINCPLKDEFGTDLAEEAVKKPCAGVLVLVKSDLYDGVAYSTEKIGAYCLSKPVAAQAFTRAINFTVATNERLLRAVRATAGVKEKMEEIKLVSRAKLLLITKLSLTEEEAHKYIEKQAMDRCVKRSVIAKEIIKTYY